MRKLALLLVLLALGATAVRLSLRSARASREAETKAAPVVEVDPVRPAANLAEPRAREGERSPLAASPSAEVAPSRESAKSTWPSTALDATVIDGQFLGLPQAALGKRAVLLLELENPSFPTYLDLEVQPNWTVELAPKFRGPCSIEAVLFEPPGLWSRRQELYLPSSPGRVAITLELLPRAKLVGLVRDDEGRPVVGASVSLGARYFAVPDSTNEFGEFSLLGELEGPHTFVIEADGFLDFEVAVDLTTSEVRYEEFVLQRPMRVAGVIRWPFGGPAEGVSLFLRSRATGEQSTTGTDGLFDFTGGPSMNFVLYARAGGESGQDFSGRFELDPVLQDLAKLDLVLQRSPSVSGVLLDDAGLAVPGSRIRLTAVDNARVTREATTRADGSFTVAGLYPGSYRVTCDRHSTLLSTVEIEPGRVQPFLELVLPTESVFGE